MNYELVKFVNGSLELEVNVSPTEETIWMDKDQIGLLFGRDRTVISRHIKNLFSDHELDKNQVCAKNARTGTDGKSYIIDYYNLDVIIAIGYRVKSPNASIFRKWASNVLREYLLKGYVINENRSLLTNENYLNLINKVNSIDNRLIKLENEKNYFPTTIIVEDNKVFDAVAYLSDIISKAKESIVLIDPYSDLKTLNTLKVKSKNVYLHIITSSKNKITEFDATSFSNEYGSLAISINNSYHDRYLIIDNLIFYHLGTSINYLGKKFSQIDKIVDDDVKQLLRNRIDEQEQKGCWVHN